MKRVLVTGCSSGFGLQAARLLAGQGDQVYASIRTPGSDTELRKLIDEGLPITVVELDVRDHDQASSVVAQIVADGGVDALVNNAGVSMFAAIEEVSIDLARSMFETNYFGPLRLIQLVLPHMRAQGHGHIVNVSSSAGFSPVAYLSTYSSAKHAIDALSFCLAIEATQFGIVVSVVSPGGYPTGVGGKFWEPDTKTDEPLYRETANRLVAGWYRHVAGRDPADVAKAIIAALNSDRPPIRTFVGDDSVMAAEKRSSLADDEWLAAMLHR